jgi:hypothetical protein
VLNGLGCGDQAAVESLTARELLDDLIRFRNDALDSLALDPLRLLAKEVEHLIEASDMVFSLVEMHAEGGLHLPRPGGLHHRRRAWTIAFSAT